MRVRLHHYIPDFGQHALNTFDLDFWKQATFLASFGVELRVFRGFVEIDLLQYVGATPPVTLHRLSRAGSGSVFSPPYFPPQMTGVILPVVVRQSDDAEFLLYFGTNDTPAYHWPRIALLTDPAWEMALRPPYERFLRDFGPEERQAVRLVVMGAQSSRLAPDMPVWHLSAGEGGGQVSGFSQAVAAFGFGALAENNFTHLCIMEPGHVPHPEMMFRMIALIRHLRPGFYAAAAIHAADSWEARGDRSLGFGSGPMDDPAWPHNVLGRNIPLDEIAVLAALALQPDLPLPGLICLPLGAIRATGLPDSGLGSLMVLDYLTRLPLKPAVCAALSVPQTSEPAGVPSSLIETEALWRGQLQVLALRGHLRGAAELEHRLQATLRLMHPDCIPDAEAVFRRVAAELGYAGLAKSGLLDWLRSAAPDFTATIAALRDQHRRAAYPFGAAIAGTPDDLWQIFTQLHQRMDRMRHEMLDLVAANERQAERRLIDIGIIDPARTRADLSRASILAVSALYNRHKGRRAVIVGNGPSLQIADLSRLKREVSFGSNKIFLSFGETNWRPTYYTVEDHLVLAGAMAEVSRMRGVRKIFPDNMRHHGFHDPDVIFVPHIPPQSWEEPLSDPEFPQFSLDLVQGLHWGSTVVYSQIQMAVFMGCSEIYLIGVDHSYQLPSVREGNTYISEGERNHFHPNYRGPGERWHQPNLDVLEVSYQRALTVCVAEGVAIFNASRTTQLEIFPRVDFDTIFPV